MATTAAATLPQTDRVARAFSGAWTRWLTDGSVTDVLINGPGPIVVERFGELHEVDSIDSVALELLIERLLGPTGRRVDRRSPVLDVRLDDRTRCHVVVPPVAVDGPYVSLRRLAVARPLEDFGDPTVVGELLRLVADRASVVVFGPTGGGKTSLLAACLGVVGSDERVVVVEEAAELPVAGPHVVRLEAQPPSVEGVGAVDVAALVRAALRMRPDRLVVGEVRGVEAAGLIHALATGHRGSMGTVHASSAEEALWRIEQLARSGGLLGDVGAQLHRSLDALVGVRRGSGGRRVVSSVHRIAEAK